MVSLIVIVYGVEQYIERSSRSFFSQTCTDIEYVFVNDCTKDNSISILQNVMKDFPDRKVVIVNHKHNMGPSAARKTGLQASSGDMVIFADSDDWMEPDMVESLLKIMIDTGADMSYCNWFEEYPTESREHREPSAVKGSYLERIISFKTNAYVWNRMVRRSLFDNVDFPDFPMLEDFVLVAQMAVKTENIVHLERPLYHYNRANVSSISTRESSLEMIYARMMNILSIHEKLLAQNHPICQTAAFGNLAIDILWNCFRYNLTNKVATSRLKSVADVVSKSSVSSDFNLKVSRQIILKLWLRAVRYLNVL